jgi:replicative DNA helicase
MTEDTRIEQLTGWTAPVNIEAEMALLGAILANNTALDRVSHFLKASHFSEGVHARIYEVLSEMISRGHVANPVTLLPYLQNDEVFEELGGAAAYLGKLAAMAAPIVDVVEYAREIYDLARRRALIEIGSDLVVEARSPDIDRSVNEIIEDTERALYEVAEDARFGQGFASFTEAMKEAIDMAAAAYQRDGGLSGLSTGLRDLDEKLGGLQPSDLIILAARPAMGKTALATTIAYHVARNYRPETMADGSVRAADGGVVAFFSLEMSAEQLATRIISAETGISSSDIRRGRISEDQFGRLVDVAQEISSIPLYIDDTGGLTIAQVAARARRIKRQHGLGLIVIDYLQLLSGSTRRALEGRVQELTEITTGLKALAKELNVPILALSQLSRQVEQRDDKRPQLADLRESGSIEQDADVVLFLFREEYYLSRREPKPGTPEHASWQEEMDRVMGIAEVIIAKQRHGPTGSVQLHFEPGLTRFGNLALEDHLPERMD